MGFAGALWKCVREKEKHTFPEGTRRSFFSISATHTNPTHTMNLTITITTDEAFALIQACEELETAILDRYDSRTRALRESDQRELDELRAIMARLRAERAAVMQPQLYIW